MGWIWEGIVNWLAGTVAGFLDGLSSLFTGVFNVDLGVFETYFPRVVDAYEVLLYLAMALLSLFTVFALVRCMWGPVGETESPLLIVTRFFIFAFLTWNAKTIFLVVLEMAKDPYQALENVITVEIEGLEVNFTQASTNIMTSIAALEIVGGIAQVIIVLVLILLIGWNYFKLMLEIVERYILLGVLCYTAPLAFCTGATSSTRNIFKSWCRMVGSQLLLMILNVWFVRIFNQAFAQGVNMVGDRNIFYLYFLSIGWLRTAIRIDAHLATLGLNVAQAGGGLLGEVAASLQIFKKNGEVAFGGMSQLFKTGKNNGSGSANGSQEGPLRPTFKDSMTSAVLDSQVENANKRAGLGGIAGVAQRGAGHIISAFGGEMSSQKVGLVMNGGMGSGARVQGDVADRSLGNMFVSMKGQDLTNTTIASGFARTTVKNPDGTLTQTTFTSAVTHNPPKGEYTTETDAFGNKYYVQSQTNDFEGIVSANPGENAQTISGSAADSGLQAYMPLPEGWHYEGTQAQAGKIETIAVNNITGEKVQMSMSKVEKPDGGNEKQFMANDGTVWASATPVTPETLQSAKEDTPKMDSTNRVPVFDGDIDGYSNTLTFSSAEQKGMLYAQDENGERSTWYEANEGERMGMTIPEDASFIQDVDGNTYWSPDYQQREGVSHENGSEKDDVLEASFVQRTPETEGTDVADAQYSVQASSAEAVVTEDVHNEVLDASYTQISDIKELDQSGKEEPITGGDRLMQETTSEGSYSSEETNMIPPVDRQQSDSQYTMQVSNQDGALIRDTEREPEHREDLLSDHQAPVSGNTVGDSNGIPDLVVSQITEKAPEGMMNGQEIKMRTQGGALKEDFADTGSMRMQQELQKEQMISSESISTAVSLLPSQEVGRKMIDQKRERSQTIGNKMRIETVKDSNKKNRKFRNGRKKKA